MIDPIKAAAFESSGDKTRVTISLPEDAAEKFKDPVWVEKFIKHMKDSGFPVSNVEHLGILDDEQSIE